MKHFINIDDFNKKELTAILKFAKKIKKNPNKYSYLLENKSLGLIFEKQSTRTRLSFSLGIKKLGGHSIELNNDQIGFGSRESEEDILKVMSQYLDFLMIRNDNHKLLDYLASLNILPIINGLSNYSHPCQVLSDIFTIEESLGKIENQKITWLGDYNNVLVSLIHAAEIFNFKLNILVPKNLIPSSQITKNKNLKFSNFATDINKTIKDSDCVMTDVWISMGEKNIKNKTQSLKKYQVNKKIMSLAKKNAIFMHCLPAHRNEEVTSEVLDGNQSIVLRQAKNRLFVQQSILNFLTENNHE